MAKLPSPSANFASVKLEEMTLRSRLLKDVHAPPTHALSKVTIVGVGQVGMAVAYSMINRNIGELAMIDIDERKLKGELMDLQHGLQFVPFVKIAASTDYAISKHSKLCIITAGARQRSDEDRSSLLKRNIAIFKGIIPHLIRYSPDCVLCVVSNPVDLMTFVAWKLSGLPSHRVFGSGTSLDSSRFRYFMSDRLGIDVGNCHGFVIGEHGDRSVVVWSGVNVAGVRLAELSPAAGSADDPENWRELHTKVVQSSDEIVRLKGYTSWAIGMCVSELASAVLKNKRSVYALSTFAKGFHGIIEDVFLSLPCVLAENGVNAVVNQPLSPGEREQLQSSARQMHAILKDLDF
ncbi:L-lactate dehydrogenase-like isoform X2 [Paramacrobiotus metropolitanus]|uniref:L-lactate dehydrogenase-like isoform X2 n=1 Tax=Paramacrobiotus metropolitanus TaxID=2943436 RepID=UPI002446027C|nr:L-lactate dehydrogenase-like isoform X2 [Paramacrobiotus metropolitanus]